MVSPPREIALQGPAKIMQFFGILFKAPHSDTVDMGNFGLRNVPSTVTEITSLTCLKFFYKTACAPRSHIACITVPFSIAGGIPKQL
jgi:hypothetical protein